MKKALVGVILLAVVIVSFTVVKDSHKDDKKFIGSWVGSEKDNQIDGMAKHWVQTRYNDGTFILMFTTVEDCEVGHLVEKGKWHIKDGLFYEYHEVSGKTDVYSYEILDDNRIKLKVKQLGVEHYNEAYEFIDTRLE